MKRMVAGGVLVGALALGGATAVRAGQRFSYPVNVVPAGNQFIIRGALGSARNAAGTVGFIGCWSDASTGGIPSVSCSAQWNGGGMSCVSTDDALFRVSQLISGDSYIEFHVWNNTANPNDPKNGTCTYLQVQNYSVFEPKVL
jgi:hypothetical protein